MLQILDVSNPAQPVALGSYGAVGALHDIGLVGQYAYLLSDSALEVVDVLNPRAPTLVSTYPDEMQAIDIANEYAYVVQGRFGSSAFRGWLSILDVSRPSRPARVGGYFIPLYHPVTGEPIPDFDDEALEPASPVDVKVVGNHAFVVDSDWRGYGLHILDVSDPAEPVRVGGYRLFFSDFPRRIEVEVVGQRLYTADDETGLHVFDVSNPARPVRIGDYYAGSEITAFSVDGTTVFVGIRGTERNGFDVIDMSNPIRPVWLGSYHVDLVSDIQVAGAYVFVAFGRMGILEIFERSASSPRQVALGMTCTDGALRLEWPITAQGFVVEFTPNLEPPVRWTVLQGAAVREGDLKTMVVDPRGNAGFYRLRKL